MNERDISRRALLKGSAALAGLLALGVPLEALEVAAANGEVVIPWLDQPEPSPDPDIQLVWEELGTYLT